MTRDTLQAWLWCLAAVALVVVVLLVRERLAVVRLRRRITELEGLTRDRDEALRDLAEVRLPALLDGGPAAAANVPVPPSLVGSGYALSLAAVIRSFTTSVETTRARADRTARNALKASMRALQGLANEQQLSISAMQDRHDDPAVLQDLLEIDHTNAQFGRRAQAIAVLCGSWPGRQRAASTLLDVVRGATSRIRDYRRVEAHSQVGSGVISRAVEPVVLAVAELLDNAARHSQPNTTVQVGIQPAHNGAAIVIDDAGVGLLDQEVRRAGELLSGHRQVEIADLGDPPQFGFAVIGALAARYGFRVSVDTQSPYGGVRAVLFLPGELLTRVDEEPAPAQSAAPARSAARPAPAAPAPAPAADAAPAVTPPTALATTANGLPRRRRRQLGAHAAPVAAAPAAPAQESAGRSPEQAAAMIGAFARGTRSGRAAGEPAPAARPEPAAPPAPAAEPPADEETLTVRRPPAAGTPSAGSRPDHEGNPAT
ncbi:ATP-binding protein [Streptantibioticus parmotrematis]|uniref:ATP-binding protein n=1 Tax=Streptantibioticus parmotrematis TaxID=2873249 RepID=UPI0033F77B30